MMKVIIPLMMSMRKINIKRLRVRKTLMSDDSNDWSAWTSNYNDNDSDNDVTDGDGDNIRPCALQYIIIHDTVLRTPLPLLICFDRGPQLSCAMLA